MIDDPSNEVCDVSHDLVLDCIYDLFLSAILKFNGFVRFGYKLLSSRKLKRPS